MFRASAFFVNSGEGFGVVLACSEFPFSEIDDFHVGHSNAVILSSVQGSPGFECVQPASHTDVNTKMKKSSCRIVYDFPSIPWLDDPPVTKERIAPNQQDDSFGVWQSSTRRSATDRYVRVVLNLLALLRYVLMLNTRSF